MFIFLSLSFAANFSLFPDEMNPHLLFNREQETHIDAAVSLGVWKDNNNSGNPIYNSGGGLTYINPCFILGYAFNPSHRVTFKLPYYFLENGPDNIYHIVGADLAYTYAKNLKGVTMSLGANVKNVAYLSDGILSKSAYPYEIGKNTFGLLFGLTGKYNLPFEGRYIGWDAAVKYDISLPAAQTPWRPGVIELYGDVLMNFPLGSVKTGISAGLGEYIALPHSGVGEEKAGIYTFTTMRIGVIFMFKHNTYLEAAESLPLDWFLNYTREGLVKIKFGYRFK
jgi:hypothetical protein